jgi:hypothetical protein
LVPQAVRSVDVVERDPEGHARRARARLHLSWGPVAKDFDLVLAIVAELGTVRLTRVSVGSSTSRFNVVWHVQRDQRTRLALELEATLDVPRLMPVGGIGDAVARGFVSAAATALDPSTPAR